jgi:uncharacterized protein YqhQ
MRPATIGGQAVIEGVMIRGRNKIALSLRRKNGTIQDRVDLHLAWRERTAFLKWVVFRGAATLFESLVIGIRYLNLSADAAMEDERGEARPRTWKNTAGQWFSISFALLLGAALFMYTPMLLSDLIRKDQNPALFNLSAGLIRFIIFFLYLFFISKMKDVQRVFEYHGAEHKSIFAYEAGKPVTVDNARPFSTHHPRCGTSFILIAGFACVLVFAVMDYIIISLSGPYRSVLHRVGVHLLFIPLVSGISYEVLRFSGKHAANPVVGRLILPGLWIQNITTREPDDSELEVAVSAVNHAL